MIYDNLLFFNVAELEKNSIGTGLLLQRFPKEVRNHLGFEGTKKGSIVSQHSTGCEIRFVTEGKAVRLFLSSIDNDGELLVYRGNFFHSRHNLKAGVITPILLEEPERFSIVTQNCLETGSFSPNVWRVVFNRYCVSYHGIDTFSHKVRPPFENEQPKLKWLAYGSSITHGSSANSYENTYIEQAAKRLKVDVRCFGMSGACYCEKEIADFIISQENLDLITLELGVNMRTCFTADEFQNRVTYLISKLLEKNKNIPIMLLSIFPNHASYALSKDGLLYIRQKEYEVMLKEVYENLKCANLFFFDGYDILNDFSALTVDLLHPSSYGHSLMGENLAKMILPLL